MSLLKVNSDVCRLCLFKWHMNLSHVYNFSKDHLCPPHHHHGPCKHAHSSHSSSGGSSSSSGGSSSSSSSGSGSGSSYLQNADGDYVDEDGNVVQNYSGGGDEQSKNKSGNDSTISASKSVSYWKMIVGAMAAGTVIAGAVMYKRKVRRPQQQRFSTASCFTSSDGILCPTLLTNTLARRRRGTWIQSRFGWFHSQNGGKRRSIGVWFYNRH